MIKQKKRFQHGCPFRSTPECFDFEGIVRDPQSAGMSAEQITEAQISPTERLYWCSECHSIWCESDNHFARRLGFQEQLGCPFVPTSVKFDTRYLGD